MTIGLFEGWQHFADDLRSDNPLLPSETWVQVLKDCEYFNAAAFPRPGSPAEDLGVHLIVGRVFDTAADGQIEAAQPVSAPPRSRVQRTQKFQVFRIEFGKQFQANATSSSMNLFSNRSLPCSNWILRSGPGRGIGFLISDLIH